MCMNLLKQNTYTLGLWLSGRHKLYVILYDIMGNHEGNCEHPISITMSMKQYLNSYKIFFGSSETWTMKDLGMILFCNLSNPVVHNLSFFVDNRAFLCPWMLLLVWVWVPGHPLHHPSWTDGASGSLLQVYGRLSNLGSSICALDRWSMTSANTISHVYWVDDMI